MSFSQTSTQIRKAVPDEASRVASVLCESFMEYKSSYTDEAYAATTPASDEIGNRISEGTVWAALNDNAIVGTVSAVLEGESIYIRSMAVIISARGQRIGELLLRHIEDFAAANGYKRLTLCSTPFLHRAIRLYEKFGFVRCGVDDLHGTPLIKMEKYL